jgi:hypothetical protein
MFTGMDAQAAHITSTIALLPAQLASGFTGRRQVSGVATVSFRRCNALDLGLRNQDSVKRILV